MSLTVKHLNNDASFSLSFSPLPSSGSQFPAQAFNILLDPWLAGTSKIWHPKFSISRLQEPSCISSLLDLPEPDLIVISQDKSDHCHQQTLTRLPAKGGKTIILAEPAAAKVIRSWKHFDPERVVTLPKWEEKKSSTLHRVSIPASTPDGRPGEVTLAYLPQKGDLTGLHSAIGITYHAPTSSSHDYHHNSLPPTPPATPPSSQNSTTQQLLPFTTSALSVIFSPHGCTYPTLAPYITQHLVSSAALPLTALLHCFDRVQSAWYLGGNICAGVPGGQEIAEKVGAQAWISAHDGDKETTGFANRKIVVERYGKEDVERLMGWSEGQSTTKTQNRLRTQVVCLGVGEQIVLDRFMSLSLEKSDG